MQHRSQGTKKFGYLVPVGMPGDKTRRQRARQRVARGRRGRYLRKLAG